MFVKILQKLKLQRGNPSNVSDRSLDDLARSLETVITTDEILVKADLTKAILSIDGNIRNYSSQQVKKINDVAEAERLEKERQEALKKKGKEDAKKKTGVQNTNTDPPEWAQSIIEQNEKLVQQMQALQTDKVTTSRKETLKKALTGLPEYYSNPILASFKETSFDTDEKFADYLQVIDKNKKGFELAAKEQGLNTSTPQVNVKVPEDNGETKELSAARKLVNKQKEKENATNSKN